MFCTTSISRKRTATLPKNPRIPLAFTIWKDVFKPMGLFGAMMGFVGVVMHYVFEGPRRTQPTPPIKRIDPPPATTAGRRTKWQPPPIPSSIAPTPSTGLGKTVVYVGELMRHPVYTRFLHWMYRHLLLPRAAVGIRNLPAVDLPLLYAVVRWRSYDAFSASLVRAWASYFSSVSRPSTGFAANVLDSCRYTLDEAHSGLILPARIRSSRPRPVSLMADRS